MKYLNQATSGIIKKPLFLLVYGTSGVGKTTLACSAPNPILLELEQGANNININRLPKPESFSQIFEMVDELTNEKHDFKTFILDSVDWAESILWTEVCREQKIKNIDELGYGKGYVIALKYWSELVDRLTKLREKMNIVLIGHSKIRPFNDPTQSIPYDRYEIKLHEKAGALLKEAADVVAFCNFETHVKKEGMKGKGFADGTRLMYLERTAGFDAKNRFGLPESLPLKWDALINAIENASSKTENTTTLKTEVSQLLANVKDEKVITSVHKFLADDKISIAKLNDIKTRLMKLTSEGANL